MSGDDDGPGPTMERQQPSLLLGDVAKRRAQLRKLAWREEGLPSPGHAAADQQAAVSEAGKLQNLLELLLWPQQLSQTLVQKPV